MTPLQLAITALLWEAGYDTADIAFALHIPEAEIWNVLTPIRGGDISKTQVGANDAPA